MATDQSRKDSRAQRTNILNVSRQISLKVFMTDIEFNFLIPPHSCDSIDSCLHVFLPIGFETANHANHTNQNEEDFAAPIARRSATN